MPDFTGPRVLSVGPYMPTHSILCSSYKLQRAMIQTVGGTGRPYLEDTSRIRLTRIFATEKRLKIQRCIRKIFEKLKHKVSFEAAAT